MFLYPGLWLAVFLLHHAFVLLFAGTHGVTAGGIAVALTADALWALLLGASMSMLRGTKLRSLSGIISVLVAVFLVVSFGFAKLYQRPFSLAFVRLDTASGGRGRGCGLGGVRPIAFCGGRVFGGWGRVHGPKDKRPGGPPVTPRAAAGVGRAGTARPSSPQRHAPWRSNAGWAGTPRRRGAGAASSLVAVAPGFRPSNVFALESW